MAVRLALLAHHYRDDWEWTEPGLAAARTRLTRWRTATRPAASHRYPGPRRLFSPGRPLNPPAPPAPPAPGVSPAESVLARVRERLADDLDAPGALTVVDHWAAATPSADSGRPSARPTASWCAT